MKKILFSMLAGIMALGALAQDGKFTVKSTFEGRGDSVGLALVDVKSSRSIERQVFQVNGQMHEMSYELKDAAMLFVLDNNNSRGYISMPAIPGETVEIYRDGNNFTHLRGSQFYVDYDIAEQSIEQPMIALKNFAGECQHRIMQGVPQEQVMKDYEERVPVLTQALADAVMAYVKAHPDQDASAALIALLEDDTESIEAAAALLTERARGSVAANLYKAILEAAQKEAEEEARQEGMVGTPAPDFTLNDINGKPLALSSLRGKWVIIDFWGSWCKWCIKGIPDMKKYYAKYGDKLEILGVDCNDTVEKWKAAVKEHDLPWLHVYWDKDNGDNPLALYGVRGFPTKVVVDPQGNVAKIIVGEDPAFYDYLDEVLK